MANVHVRLEASDVPWDELTPDQQEAAERVVGLLKSFADQPSAPSRPDADALSKPCGGKTGQWYLPWVDGVRANSVVLLDGGRGSGKTTVLLTLVHAWSAARRDALLPRLAASSNTPGRSPVDPRRNNGKVPGDERFLPLDLIDLQPIPDGSSLVLRVAGAFRRLVEHIKLRAREQEFREEPPRSSELWNRFVQVAASGWEPNVSARKGTLEPEAYALELGLAEERGRDIQTSFRAFVDALLGDLREHPGEALCPLFIVAIDDSDMNVPRSFELITLLRTIWHPRVAFVLTGFSEMFLLALRSHFLGEARRPLRGLRTSDDELRALNEPHKPIQYAEELYFRVIPPRHRCELKEIKPDVRFQYIPRPRADVPVQPSLRDLLATFTLAQDLAAATDAEAESRPRGSSLAKYFEEHRALRRALPDRMRALEDVRLRLAEFAVQEPKKSVAEIAYYLLGAAMRLSTLLPNEVDELERIIELDESAEPKHLFVYPGPLEIRWTHRLLHQVSFIPGVTLDLQLPLELPRISVSVTARAARFDLPENVTAALLLVLDLVADGAGSLVGPSPLAKNPPELVVVRLQASSLSSTSPESWPLPAWESPRDYTLAAEAWAEAWRNKGTKDITSEAILEAFLGALLGVAERRRTDTKEPESWSSRLGKLAGSMGESRREKVERDWARDAVGSLLYPEAGLARKVREEDLEQGLHEATYRDEHDSPRSLLNRDRFDRLRVESTTRRLVEHYPTNSAEEIGRMVTALHAYLDRLEKVVLSLDALLGGIRVVQPAGSFLGNTQERTLDKYLRSRRELTAQLRSDEIEALEPVLAPFTGRLGVASTVIVAMWSVLTRLNARTELSPVLYLSDGLRVRQTQVMLRDQWSVVASVAYTDARASANTSVNLQLRMIHLDVTAENEQRLPPSLELVYRIAFDLSVDENDLSEEEEEIAMVTWPGAQLQWREHDIVARWVAVPWKAPLDREVLRSAWNDFVIGASDALMKLPEMRREGNSPRGLAPTPVLDSLVFQHLRAVRAIAEERRPAPFQWSDANVPTKEAWVSLMREYFIERTPKPRGNRWIAFCRFRALLPLFAAPEAGLSKEAAQHLLLALPPAILKPKKALQAARRALVMMEADIEQASGSPLTTIDDLYADHPFVKKFGRHAPPRTP